MKNMGKLIRRVIAILLCVTGIMLLLIPATVAEASFEKGDFIYDGNILQKYTGTDPDVTIPLGVTQIGKDAFSGNDNLRSVYIPKGIDIIGFSAFENCKNLESVVMEDDVKKIGQSAFSGCQNLKNVNLSRYVEDIGSGAFAACSNLSNIEVDPQNRNYICLDGVLYTKDGKKLVQYLAGRPYSTYDIPEPVTEIGEFGFYGANMLTDVGIVQGVKEIPEYAFLNCNALNNVTIPTSVEAIRNGAFGGCPNLTSLAIPAQVRYIDPNAFTSRTGVRGDMVDSNTGAVLSVASDSLNNSQATEQLPNNEISYINELDNKPGYVIDNNNQPVYTDEGQSDQLMSSIDESPNDPGNQVANQTQQSINSGLDNLADLIAKAPQELLKNNEIARTTIVGGQAVFMMSPKALSVYGFDFNTAQVEDSIADSGNQTIEGDTYRDYSGNEFDVINGNFGHYGGQGGSVTVPDGIYKLGNRAFYKANNIDEVILPNTCNEIGDFAFARSSAKSVKLPENLEKIGYAAFYNAKDLTDLIIPSTVKDIELGALEGSGYYENWKNIEDGKDFLVVGDGILAGYKGLLKDIVIPDGVKKIGPGVFEGLSRIESVTLPESVTEIGEDAFNGCTNLSNIQLPTMLQTIEDRAFKDTGLKNVDIPASVTNIGLGAFDTVRTNGGLETVTFGGSNLPNVSYKPTASRLSAENLRTSAFEGAKYALINKNADINSGNIFDPYQYGFRGEVLSDLPTAEDGTKQVELRKSLKQPNYEGLIDIDGSKIINGRPFMLAGVRESAFNAYNNTDWCDYPVNGISIRGNNSAALQDLIDATPINNDNFNQAPISIAVDSLLGINPGAVNAVIPNNPNRFNMTIKRDLELQDNFREAFSNRYGRSDNVSMETLSIDMMDKLNAIPIHKMATDKMEIAMQVPGNIAGASDIRVATLDDNGMLENVTSDTLELGDGSKVVHFVASHLSPFAIYYFNDTQIVNDESSELITEEITVVEDNASLSAKDPEELIVKTLNKKVTGNIATKTIIAIILILGAIMLFAIPDVLLRIKESKED